MKKATKLKSLLIEAGYIKRDPKIEPLFKNWLKKSGLKPSEEQEHFMYFAFEAGMKAKPVVVPHNGFSRPKGDDFQKMMKLAHESGKNSRNLKVAKVS